MGEENCEISKVVKPEGRIPCALCLLNAKFVKLKSLERNCEQIDRNSEIGINLASSSNVEI